MTEQEYKEKIKRLERELEVEKQARSSLKEGYDILMELYTKLNQGYNQIKDEIKKNFINLAGQSLDENQISLNEIVIVMKEFSDFKMKYNKDIEELREQTFAAIDNYNSKIKKLNEMLSKIDDEKLADQISEIFKSENESNANNMEGI